MRNKLAIVFHSVIFFSGILLLALSATSAKAVNEIDLARNCEYDMLCYRCADGPDQVGDIRTIKVSYKKFRSIHERDEFTDKDFFAISHLQRIQNIKEISFGYTQPSVLHGPLFIRYEVFRI